MALNLLQSHHYGLGLHTCSPELGLAIDNFTGDQRLQTWNLERSLSTLLHHHLQEFIVPRKFQDLAFIAVAKGPGGFTGTRLGVTTARTLAQQLNIPLFAISTLAAIAHGAQPLLEGEELIAVEMAASRNKLFTAIYDSQTLTIALSEQVRPPEAWEQQLKQLTQTYKLITAPKHLGNTVGALVAMAHILWKQGDRPHWSKALPFYGQSPV